MQAIQFYSAEEVVKGYNFKKVDTWSIWQGKTLIMTGSGGEELESFLEMIDSSNAVYNLCMYNDAEPKEITNKTEYNASYGFKLNGGGGAAVGGSSGGRSFTAAVDPITKAINDKIAGRIGAMVDEVLSGEKEDKPPKFWDVIMEHMQNPDVFVPITTAAIGFLNKFAPAGSAVAGPQLQPAYVPSAAIGAITDDSNADTYTRLVNVIDRLEKADPKILIHLEKLAGVAENQKATFDMLIGMLEKM